MSHQNLPVAKSRTAGAGHLQEEGTLPRVPRCAGARTGARATWPPHVQHHVPTDRWRPSTTTATEGLEKCIRATAVLTFYPTRFCIRFQYYPLSKRFTDAYPERHPSLFQGVKSESPPVVKPPSTPPRCPAWPAASIRVLLPPHFVNVSKL